MTRLAPIVLKAAAALAFAASAVSASAGSAPSGIWLDHTGRGAIEITECGGKLCGRIVWLKDGKNAKACGLQVIGNVAPVAEGRWDRGWIYDPDNDDRFSVELTPLGDRLKVVGYVGSKLLSETMIWTRAPADIKRCA